MKNKFYKLQTFFLHKKLFVSNHKTNLNIIIRYKYARCINYINHTTTENVCF